jgi:SNF family Na+-dependent transporter
MSMTRRACAGRLYQKGALAFGSIHRRARGVGAIQGIAGMAIATYYSSIIAWCLYYFCASFAWCDLSQLARAWNSLISRLVSLHVRTDGTVPTHAAQ